MAPRIRDCCRRAMEGYPPCEPCQLLMQSDAFSGVDARHEDETTRQVWPEPDSLFEPVETDPNLWRDAKRKGRDD
jgi:hypothetical protein